MHTQMAMKHRKLFPSSSPNNTFDGCPDICDPTIPYPDFGVLPPPLSLSPQPPPELYITSNKSSQHVSPYVIIIISLLASLFLIVGYYVIIVKYCKGCRRFRRRTTLSAETSEDRELEFLGEIHGPILDHPIWYITTVGLQSSVINSITIFKYKKCDNLIEGLDCSVCLSEFQDDDTLRLLPKCNHAFHIPCIDTWLRSHTTCPLCRAGIVPNYDVNICATLNDHNSSVSGTSEESRLDNAAIGGEFTDFNQLRNEIIGSREVADDGGTENCEIGDQRKEITSIKTDTFSNRNATFEVVENSSNNKKTIKRSFSVDLNSTGDTLVVNFDERSSSAAETLPVRMKRSVSCSGKFFLSRHLRGQSSILPL